MGCQVGMNFLLKTLLPFLIKAGVSNAEYDFKYSCVLLIKEGKAERLRETL
jgi:hypothetical protein